MGGFVNTIIQTDKFSVNIFNKGIEQLFSPFFISILFLQDLFYDGYRKIED